ncbi:hypothetical protein SAMN04488602_1434 [Paenibacillus sp. cl123]|nr:hypothetical protein SAMN04488602_1434 [Paenibacillus sp. cl123]
MDRKHTLYTWPLLSFVFISMLIAAYSYVI